MLNEEKRCLQELPKVSLRPPLSRWSCSGWLHHFQFDEIVLYDEVTLHRAYFQVLQSLDVGKFIMSN